MTTATKLDEVQARIQAGILDLDDGALDEIVDSPRENRAVLFGVYRNAYRLRLIEVLGIDYEQLHGYLGDDQFDALARAYIAANPSSYRSARDFGCRMPEFCAATAPWSERPEIAEIAALERALNDAFDGSDAAPMRQAVLLEIAPQDWGRIVVEPHPTARRLDFSTNAFDIWSALKAEAAPPAAVALDGVEPVLVWRKDLMPMARKLSADEAMMWDEARTGVPFGVLCEMMATMFDAAEAPGRAANHLLVWIEAGLLV